MASEMILKLNAPGMTALHKAGLAGLYMTLEAFDEQRKTIDGLEWKLHKQQISLQWTEATPKAAFEKLVRSSFRIDEDGFIRLTGLEPKLEMTRAHRHHLYLGLLNSFLQFGPHRPTGNKRTLTYEIDDKKYWLKDFAPIKKIRQNEAVSDFTDSSGHFKNEIETAGWLYPGGGQRHVAHGNTTLRDDLNSAFSLLFAPVGVIYYLLNSKSKGRKSRLAMLVPEIKDLESYAEMRGVIAAQGVMEMTASGASDAVLRMLVAIEANQTSNQFAALLRDNFLCRVVTFGIVSWNEKQKSRTYTRSVFSGKLSGFENYHLAHSIFQNRWQQIKAKVDRRGNETEPERVFITTFTAREMIADNIANGKTWYDDISTFMSGREISEQFLKYEREKLAEMVEKATFDDERERLFIYVCHESWRRRMGKLGQRAVAENANFASLVNKDREKLRTSLARCKNAESLRETVVDFWSRGGTNENLQGDGLISLLPLFNEKNWRKAKDLALLALVSYKPQTKEEAEVLQTANKLEIETPDNLGETE